MRDQDSVAVLSIGATRCYGDEWFRELTVQGVTFLAPLDQQDKARHILQSQQDGAQGGEAVRAFGYARWHPKHGYQREGYNERRVYLHPLGDTGTGWLDIPLFPRPAIAPQATPAADTLRFTDATIDKMQAVMAVHGFIVPVRVISDAFRTTIFALAAPPAEVKP